MPTKGIDPEKLFLMIGGLCSVAGLAQLLRSDKEITIRNVLSAITMSVVVGVGIAMIWYHQWGDESPWFLFGLSTFASIGGADVIKLVFAFWAKRAGVPISGEEISDIVDNNEETKK